jgi:hypothetical protein
VQGELGFTNLTDAGERECRHGGPVIVHARVSITLAKLTPAFSLALPVQRPREAA